MIESIRGRWNAGATSPRFRGRGGFASNQMGQPTRGRGGQQFFRGGRGGAGAQRFPNSGNFDQQNWNAPPMYGNSHMGFGNQQGGDQQNQAPFHQVCHRKYLCVCVWLKLIKKSQWNSFSFY